MKTLVVLKSLAELPHDKTAVAAEAASANLNLSSRPSRPAPGNLTKEQGHRPAMPVVGGISRHRWGLNE